MRLSVSSAIASFVVALSTQCSLAVAQDDASRSNIRLTSATAPVSNATGYESTARSGQAAADERQDAAPAPQFEQTTEQPVRSSAPPTIHTSVELPAAQVPKMPAGFYASSAARSTLNQLPGPAPVQSAPRLQANRRGGKPFQAIPTQPTISPYLYLNAGTNNANLTTNYFAFVRPQMEQQEASRQQQREIQQLRSQLQKMSSTGTGAQPAGNPSGAAHYMDTAQFYRGLQR